MLRMRFESGLSVADIARLLGLEQKSLYREIHKLLAGLRVQLEHAGFTAHTAAQVLEGGGFAILEAAIWPDEKFETGVRPIEDEGAPR
jgi:hypothetical protein